MRVGLLLAALVLAAGLATPAAGAADPPGGGLLGRPAPEWTVEHWINSPPLTVEGLRGRVVLVRWWTAPGCPFCAESAPALNRLAARYGERGLTVVGLYHHKSRDPLRPADVARHARRFRFRFPLAVDTGWTTLRRWWLDRGDPGWTSVSFLLDRRGIVRWIHPGGSYPLGSDDYAELERTIEELLPE